MANEINPAKQMDAVPMVPAGGGDTVPRPQILVMEEGKQIHRFTFDDPRVQVNEKNGSRSDAYGFHEVAYVFPLKKGDRAKELRFITPKACKAVVQTNDLNISPWGKCTRKFTIRMDPVDNQACIPFLTEASALDKSLEAGGSLLDRAQGVKLPYKSFLSLSDDGSVSISGDIELAGDRRPKDYFTSYAIADEKTTAEPVEKMIPGRPVVAHFVVTGIVTSNNQKGEKVRRRSGILCLLRSRSG